MCVIGENEEKCERDFSVEGSQRVSSRLTFFLGDEVCRCVIVLSYFIFPRWYRLGGIGIVGGVVDVHYFLDDGSLKQMNKSCIALLLFGVVFRHCSFLCYFHSILLTDPTSPP